MFNGINWEEVGHKLQFRFDEDDNENQATDPANVTYGPNSEQFWFRRFQQDAQYIGIPIIENVDKILEMIEVNWHVSCHKAFFRKKLNVWGVPHELS